MIATLLAIRIEVPYLSCLTFTILPVNGHNDVFHTILSHNSRDHRPALFSGPAERRVRRSVENRPSTFANQSSKVEDVPLTPQIPFPRS
jgi:hypothetical protein